MSLIKTDIHDTTNHKQLDIAEQKSSGTDQSSVSANISK